MWKVLDCFVTAHDWRLVALAAVLCGLASGAAVEILRHAGARNGEGRLAWLAVAGVAGGSGIWATHFVAMLAFEPRLPTGYDVGLTLMSLVVAVGLTTLGLGAALSTRRGLGGGHPCPA